MGSDDDLLDPGEIEALLNQAGGGESAPAAEVPPPAAPAADEGNGGDLLDAGDIESLLQGGAAPAAASPQAAIPQAASPPASQQPAGNAPPPVATTSAAAEQLINEAEAHLAAAIAPNLGASGMAQDVSGATAFALNQLAQALPGEERTELSMLQDVELDLRIELGRTELMIEEVVALSSGSVVPLDKLAGDPVDILVNGRLIARGEVLVLNDNFCVRIAEILSPQ